eukprot:3323740-Prymnesium_polylepis.1
MCIRDRASAGPRRSASRCARPPRRMRAAPARAGRRATARARVGERGRERSRGCLLYTSPSPRDAHES